MSLTILEVLQNAEYNLKEGNQNFQQKIGYQQLKNAVYLLSEKDKQVDDIYNEEDVTCL